MIVAAPARLSTSTGWPSADESFGAIVRALRSTGPPAGNGTTSRRGFEGNGVCAGAGGANARQKADPAAAATTRRVRSARPFDPSERIAPQTAVDRQHGARDVACDR